jgi:hypothetical protein
MQDSLTQPLRVGLGLGVSSSNSDDPFLTATASKRISLLEGDHTQLTAKARVEVDPRSSKVSAAASCLLACLPGYLLAWLPACLLACLLAYLLAGWPACLPACLVACLPACLLACLPFCLLLSFFALSTTYHQ